MKKLTHEERLRLESVTSIITGHCERDRRCQRPLAPTWAGFVPEYDPRVSGRCAICHETYATTNKERLRGYYTEEH